MPSRRSRFERWLSTLERVEQGLLRATILCLLLLVVAQALLASDARSLLSYVYRLEGVAYDPQAMAEGGSTGALYLSRERRVVETVTLALIDRPSAPEVRLLVNGYPVADFSHPVLTIEVHPGDRLELDAGAASGPVRVRVVDASDRLGSPREGEEFELDGGIERFSVSRRAEPAR